MNRPNSITAWDYVWRQTQHVHNVGNQIESTPTQKRVAEALDTLCKMRLPLAAIYAIGEAVEAAEKRGRES